MDCFLVSSNTQANNNQTIAAKIIANENTRETVYTSNGGIEGWSNVSFIVDANGIPKNITVFDSLDTSRYEAKTIRYIKNLKFTPALLDGTPISNAKNMFVSHTYAAAGHSEASVTPAFEKEYQVIVDALADSSPKMDEVKVLIDNLVNDHTKNLNEHALSAWIKSIYYYKNQDFLEYMRQSQITVDLYKYLPLPILSKSIVNLFESQLYFGYFFEANQTLNRMINMQGLNVSEQTKQEFLELVRNKKTAATKLTIQGKLSPLGAWSYHHKLQKFKISLTTGNINSAELRCANYQQSFLQNWQHTITVPTEAEACILIINGVNGSEFEITEVSS